MPAACSFSAAALNSSQVVGISMPFSSRICLLPQIQFTRWTFTGAAPPLVLALHVGGDLRGQHVRPAVLLGNGADVGQAGLSYHSWIAGPSAARRSAHCRQHAGAQRVIAASPPPPATGMSVQVPPRPRTAPAGRRPISPRRRHVHQCSTSAVGSAIAGAASITAVEAARTDLMFMDPPRSIPRGFVIRVWVDHAASPVMSATQCSHAPSSFRSVTLQTVT